MAVYSKGSKAGDLVAHIDVYVEAWFKHAFRLIEDAKPTGDALVKSRLDLINKVKELFPELDGK